MSGGGLKATLIGSIVGSIVTLLVAYIVMTPGVEQKPSGEVVTQAQNTGQEAANAAIKSHSESINALVKKYAAVDKKLKALEGKKLLINRCRVRTAAKESLSSSYGQGSIAMCKDEELAIGGACQVLMGIRGANSRLITEDDGKPSGYECILTRGVSMDKVKASAICCQ